MSRTDNTRCMCQLCNRKPVNESEEYRLCDLSPQRITELLRKAFDRLKEHTHLKIVVSYEKDKNLAATDNEVFTTILTDNTYQLIIELTRISMETTDENEREDINKILDNLYITNPHQDNIFMWFYGGLISDEEVDTFKLLTENEIRSISTMVGKDDEPLDYIEGDPIPELPTESKIPKVVLMGMNRKNDLPN